MKDKKGQRGELTDEIKKLSQELLGYEISVNELRLMVYVMYEATNFKKLNHRQTNHQEFLILNEWEKKGYITDTWKKKFKLSKEFWDAMCQIIWKGYVDVI